MPTTTYQLPPSGFKGDYAHRKAWLQRHCTWRVRVLIAVNEARLVLPLFEKQRPGDDRPRKAIEVAQQVADGLAADAAYAAGLAADAAYAAAYAAADAADAAADAAYAAAYAADAAAYAADAAADAADAAAYAAYAAADAADAADAAFLDQQDRRMSLFLPVATWQSAWHTTNTQSLAHTIYDSQDWSLCPILADALQDAGCDDDGIIGALVQCWPNFGRGTWLIDRLTGRHEFLGPLPQTSE